MKATTTTIKRSAILLIIAVLSISEIFAQDYPCTVIDVKGSRYGDSMWLFTVEGTTDGYDNGWDGYKILGSSLSPQIFALDANDTKYQVMTSPNVNGTNIGFIPGEDSAYTFNFTHYSLNLAYQQLYLVDKLNNQTVDIYAQGSVFNFNCTAADAQDRFTVITFIEKTMDTTTVIVEEPIVVIPEEPLIEEPIVDNPTNDNGKNNKGGKKKGINKKKGIKVFSTSDVLVVDNPHLSNAKAKLIDAKTGRKVKEFKVNAKSVTTIKSEVKKGTYIVNVKNETEEINTMVLL